VVSGHLLVIGDDEPQEATPGSTFVAPRGNRHGFSNPYGEEARVLGLWAPPEPNVLALETYGLVKHRCSCTPRAP
jgi:mannose-6-phosphate isomerase-like protein (cupin superfamily)